MKIGVKSEPWQRDLVPGDGAEDGHVNASAQDERVADADHSPDEAEGDPVQIVKYVRQSGEGPESLKDKEDQLPARVLTQAARYSAGASKGVLCCGKGV